MIADCLMYSHNLVELMTPVVGGRLLTTFS